MHVPRYKLSYIHAGAHTHAQTYRCTCLQIQSINQSAICGLSHTEASQHVVAQEVKYHNITLSVHLLMGTSVQGAAWQMQQKIHQG